MKHSVAFDANGTARTTDLADGRRDQRDLTGTHRGTHLATGAAPRALSEALARAR